jgi:asparagine synthase (glutamine-hydrolysing)
MRAMNGYVKYGDSPCFAYATWNDKFKEEKVNFEDENYLIQFDGIITNSELLKKNYGCNDNTSILKMAFCEHREKLPLFVKGAYSLVIFDKKNEFLFVTNDLLSKRTLYYRILADSFFYASSYYDLLLLLKDAKATFEIDDLAIKSMIEDGFLVDKNTYVKEVLYLNAFESIVVDLKNNSAKVVTHEIKKVEMPDKEDEIIELFNEVFSNAVKAQFDLNEKYGYRQYLTISGGMDSRACLLQALKSGYNDILCISYSNTGSLDCTIAHQIAVSLGLELLYYPLDSARFINRLHESMYCNECQQSGIGSTAARTMSNLLDLTHCGIINLGICGGELMGDLITETRNGKALRGSFNKIRQVLSLNSKKDEDYTLNLDTLLGLLRACQNFTHMFIDKCESVSPFMDEDVFTFVLQIKPKLLFRRSLYIKWMQKYLPNSFVTTNTGAKFYSSGITVILNKLKYSLQTKLTGKSIEDMTPHNYWFNNHPEYAEKCTAEYNDNLEYFKSVGVDGKIVNTFEKNWNKGWLKKLYLLTAMQGVKDIYTLGK